MQFYPYRGRVAQGAYGIMEPLACGAVEPCEIDVMVVPGVVFARNGERMGRGKGYYDRYMSLPGFRAYKIGVCYSQQLVDFIPCEPHDIVMDEVIYR
jgi:5-formyltetrahydrofolate cyclo-ligase